jgi:ElaB/YqjD/DUF883 family membrane-anchored ribosome-binding protein
MQETSAAWHETGSGAGTSEAMRERLGGMRTELRDFDEQTRTFLREHPLMAIVGAVAAGYVIGRLMSRL